MIQTIIPWIIKALIPSAPEWAILLLVEGIPAIFDIVATLKASQLAGADKFKLASEQAGEALDEALDALPTWGDISEERRDTIIGGLVELVVFIAVDAGGLGTPRRARKDFRRALRTAAKQLREERAGE